MEAEKGHITKSLRPYVHLFPMAGGKEQTVKRNANVADTVKFIPKVVAKTRWQVKQFADRELKHIPYEAACKKLWHFVKDHIAYEKDADGKEQVRSPRRLIYDKKGDCDCYTVFISCCLSALSDKLKIIHRITKYSKDHFQHIYPVVVLPSGREIIMDCVTNYYNYEEPFKEKQDHPMELTYLDGIPDKTQPDAQQLYEDSGMKELGALFKRKKTDEPKKKFGERLKDFGQKVKTGISKTIHAVNRVNPVTVLLRNGLLAAMKLNMMKVPQRLKYAYLSDAEAQKRGIDMVKFQRLKQLREKMEKIFHGAGGKPENLKEAILTGRGNANKEVNGLGYIYDSQMEMMNLNTPLPLILGQELYYSENVENGEEMKGLGSLGEPVTAATSVTAASGILAAIAAILKNIGNIFKAKEKGSEDFENTADADQQAATTPATDLDNFSVPEDEPVMTTRSAEITTGENTTTDESKDKSPDDKPEGTWWERNKKWAKPTAWVAGILTALGIGYGVYSSTQKGKKKTKQVDGIPPLNSKKGKTKAKGLSGTEDITPVALM
ncbi:MAG: hypothetical protein ACOZCO_10615 [Bacteroidota bacterium]